MFACAAYGPMTPFHEWPTYLPESSNTAVMTAGRPQDLPLAPKSCALAHNQANR